jgi:nicotinamidase-related amidase
MVNDLVHPQGKKASNGVAEQVAKRNVLEATATAIDHARERKIPVIYVVMGFSPGFADWPDNSPMFRAPDDESKPTLGTWGTEVHQDISPKPDDPVVVKRRVSPFYSTHLDLLLRNQNVDTVLLVGVSTDLVVLSAARDAHDRDYRVEVLEDATAGRNTTVHDAAMTLIGHTATITTVDKAFAARD